MRERVERVWFTDESGSVGAMTGNLANRVGRQESLAEVAHEARNMVTALALYCDLLEEPGVLAFPFAHYGSDLRMVTAASRRLVERLGALGVSQAIDSCQLPVRKAAAGWSLQTRWTAGKEKQRAWDPSQAPPISNLAEELLMNRNLLAALAGPAIALTVETEGGARPIPMTGEEVTRVLVNLVKNAAEAMPEGGRICIRLSEREAEAGASRLVISVEDNGPGIADDALETVFERGYTTRGLKGAAAHRGAGLAICRSIVEAAGGTLCALRRDEPGACFEMELPAIERTGEQEDGRRVAFVVS